MTPWAELVGACTTLTRLPVGGWTVTHPPPGRCAWAFPVVGAIVGGMGAAVLAMLIRAGLSQPVAVLCTLAATVLLTGGLHEDGLADTADGFGGGRTAERKLAIMHDSRIGSFGALALLFSVALRAVPLATMPHPAFALLVAAILGRGAMLLPVLLLQPARADGSGAPLGEAPVARIGLGLALSAATALWLPWPALAALLAGLAVTVLAKRQVGGYTGDVLGAVEQAVECAVLASA